MANGQVHLGITARDLVVGGAITFRPRQLFTNPGGLRSPLRFDVEALLASPPLRRAIVRALADSIAASTPQGKVGIVVATNNWGLALASPVAELLGASLLHIGGRELAEPSTAQLPPLAVRVAIVEPFMATGKRSLTVADVLAAAGARASVCACVFSYDLPSAADGFANKGVDLISLVDLIGVTRAAFEAGVLEAAEADLVLAWAVRRGVPGAHDLLAGPARRTREKESEHGGRESGRDKRMSIRERLSRAVSVLSSTDPTR